MVLHADEFEGQGQRPKSPGTKKRHFAALSSACMWCMFGKTSLGSSVVFKFPLVSSKLGFENFTPKSEAVSNPLTRARPCMERCHMMLIIKIGPLVRAPGDCKNKIEKGQLRNHEVTSNVFAQTIHGTAAPHRYHLSNRCLPNVMKINVKINTMQSTNILLFVRLLSLRY